MAVRTGAVGVLAYFQSTLGMWGNYLGVMGQLFWLYACIFDCIRVYPAGGGLSLAVVLSCLLADVRHVTAMWVPVASGSVHSSFECTNDALSIARANRTV